MDEPMWSECSTGSRRARLYREGVVTVDGRLMVMGSTTWADEPLPLLRDQQIIGTVSDVHREEDGWVTGDLHTDRPLSGLCAEADFDRVSTVPEDDDLVFTAARLRAVTLGTRPCWDGMEIGSADE